MLRKYLNKKKKPHTLYTKEYKNESKYESFQMKTNCSSQDMVSNKKKKKEHKKSTEQCIPSTANA